MLLRHLLNNPEDSIMFEVSQLRVGGLDDNFSYVIHDSETGDMAVVDPTGDISLIFAKLAGYPRGNLRYIFITHGHADHISGLDELRSNFPSTVIAHPLCRIRSSVLVSDRMRLPFGDSFVECIFTPGHAVSSICYLLGDNSALFTGDTLFIGCCGYCDPKLMFRTMREILFKLPDSAVVYSGHDYGEVPFDTLGNQKKVNPFLYLTNYKEFAEEVKNL